MRQQRPPADTAPAVFQLRPLWVGAGCVAIFFASVVSIAVGAISLSPWAVAKELVGGLPLIDLDSGLTDTQSDIVWVIRAPRLVLGLLVGALLSISGAAYQGVFRNPLASPYLLGVGAGAGLGATIAFAGGIGNASGTFDAVPLFAFVGALLAVGITYAVGSSGGRLGTPATLLLAGTAVSGLLLAAQTYIQQRSVENLRGVYTWILGRLVTAGWGEVVLLLPYAVVCIGLLLASRRLLDVLSVGDEEVASLGLDANRVRLAIVVIASLAAAAAVSVSGLIGFVGLVVPHAVRMAFGSSNRSVLPLSVLFGAAFLALADVAARLVDRPAEVPIGVITALVGAPFFLLLLRRRGAGFVT